jgi:uncharacterized membrane protein YdjX (TVP38/TMEM64 family)
MVLSTPVDASNDSGIHRRHAPSGSAFTAPVEIGPTVAIGQKQEPPTKMRGNDGVMTDVGSLCIIFLVSLTFVVMSIYFLVISDLDEKKRSTIRFPTSLSVAQALGETLMAYATHSPGRLLLAHALVYLFLQTWAIPGTVFINLLGGALFGLMLGFPLCLLYNTAGSCFMYGLSKRYGGTLVRRNFPDKMAQLRGMIDNHRDDLTLYMIFLRVFPFTPNWFINMSSPHLAIPLRQFIPSIALGLIPYNFLSCKAGLILSALQSKSDIIDTATTIQLIIVAVVGFVFLPRLKKRFTTPS